MEYDAADLEGDEAQYDAAEYGAASYSDQPELGYQARHQGALSEAPPPSSSGRRHGNISSKGWAGAVVWAKSSRYPWWPSIVLAEQQVPNNEDPPRLGAIPVRLFGNREFMWMESQRAVSAFEVDQHERSNATKMPMFQQALQEALHYQETGQLPNGFNYVEEVGAKGKGRKKQEPHPKQAHLKHTGPPKVSTKAKAAPTDLLHTVGPAVSKPKTKPRSRAAPKAPSTPTAHAAPGPTSQAFPAAPLAKEQRRLNILRQLALIPPVGSPYEMQPVINPNLSAKFKSFIPIVTTKRLRISANKDVLPAADESPDDSQTS